MTKREREKLGKLATKISDNLPGDRTCDCYNLEGEPSDNECDLHWAVRKLLDVANGDDFPTVGT